MTQSINSHIELLITGGTLDKDYETTSGELIFTETHTNQILAEANCQLNIKPQLLMLKDSLQMTNTNRQTIYQACLNSQSNRIVITHGTDTMVNTAHYLLSQADITEKTIILTGAMRPYMLGRSDAGFNLGSALTAVQLIGKGVFISMNGKLFNADNVQKNRTIGIFESI